MAGQYQSEKSYLPRTTNTERTEKPTRNAPHWLSVERQVSGAIGSAGEICAALAESLGLPVPVFYGHSTCKSLSLGSLYGIGSTSLSLVTIVL